VSGQSRVWKVQFLEQYPLAICADGSPAAYYYREGIEKSRRWLIFLEGGGWCWDEASCNNLWNQGGKNEAMSSMQFARSEEDIARWISHDGIFHETKSPFADANFIFVRLCSGDAFMGDYSPPDMSIRTHSQRWHFRGKRILDAVFRDLQDNRGLGSTPGDLVIYGGCSAGARGAMVSIDYYANLLANKVKMIGFLDSPLWVPMVPADSTTTSLVEETKKVLVQANATSFLSKECQKRFGVNKRWKCLFAAFRLPFVQTPYLLNMNQYDEFQLKYNLESSIKRKGNLNQRLLSAKELQYVQEFRKKIRKYLPTPKQGSGMTVFSPGSYHHCTSFDSAYYILRVNGIPLPSLTVQWLNSWPDSPLTAVLEEDCKEFNCGWKKSLMSMMIGRAQIINAQEVRQLQGIKIPAPATNNSVFVL